MSDPRSNHQSSTLTVGAWTLDVEGRRVSGPAGSRRLEPKAMALLVVLASRAGRVVPRRDLLHAAWGDEMATDDVLSRSISEVRRALGDDPRNPSIIETIRGTGYRLLVPEASTGEQPAQENESAARAMPDRAPEGVPLRGRSERVRVLRRIAAAGGLVLLAAGTGLGATWIAGRKPDADERWILEPLTSIPGAEEYARVSPDGGRLAYTMRGPDSSLHELVVQSISGSNRVRIAAGAMRYLAWSPDGAEITFARPDSAGWEIVAVPSLGGLERRIGHLARPVLGGIDWSADERTIAVSSPRRPFAPFGIELLDAHSAQLRDMPVVGRTTVGDVYPAFLHDGHRVAFARYVSETGADLFLADVDRGSETRLTTDGDAISAIATSADGRSITYATDRDGRSTIWSVPVNGGRGRRLLDTEHAVTALSHAREGDVLVAAVAERRQNLWKVELDDDAPPARYMASTRVDGLPSFSPADDRVAFISTRAGAADLWIASRGGGEPARITELGSLGGVPSWSPDGERIAVQRRADDRTTVWIVDIARRSAAPLTHGLGDLIAPTWSRDGSAVLASSNVTGGWEIWRLPMDGGEARRITQRGGLRAMESADGARVYFTRAEERGLWVHDLATGTERAVLPSWPAGNWTNWVLAGEAVIAAEPDSAGRQRIVRRSLSSGDSTVLVRGARVPMGTGGLAISADGRTLLYGQAERLEADLYRVVRCATASSPLAGGCARAGGSR